jgi:hypothetical protein
VLVSGGRAYDDADPLSQFMDELARRIAIDAMIDGDARGADRMAGE